MPISLEGGADVPNRVLRGPATVTRCRPRSDMEAAMNTTPVINDDFIEGIFELEQNWSAPYIERCEDGSYVVTSFNAFRSTKAIGASNRREAEGIRAEWEQQMQARKLPTLAEIEAALPELDRMKAAARGKPEFKKICAARSAAYHICGYVRDGRGRYVTVEELRSRDPLARMPERDRRI